MSEYPRKHEVRPELGITEEVARQLDRSLWEMEQGGVVGDKPEIVLDPSSETWGNIHPSDIGTGSQSLAKASSNEQVRFGAMVEREKNADPGLEHAEAYDRSVEKFESMDEEEDDE